MFDLISQVQKPASGEIVGLPSKNEILYQTQNPIFFGSLTGKDLRDFIFSVATSHRKIDQNLDDHFRHKYQKLLTRKLGDMSVGERRWLLLFLESHLNKKLYLLDEPLAGVDLVAKLDIERTIQNLAAGDSVVIVFTHELNQMSKQNCQVHLLNNGKMKRYDSYDEFISFSETGNPEEAFAKIISA